jgi:hypothetical protein
VGTESNMMVAIAAHAIWLCAGHISLARSPLLAEVAAGFAGGAVKTALFYPLDSLTTQAEIKRTAAPQAELAVGRARPISSRVRPLYRGLSVSLLCSLPYACAFHTANSLAAGWIAALLPMLGADAVTALAASFASIVGTVFGVPSEYLKHRAQVGAAGFETLQATLRSALAHPRLLYTGFQSTLFRNVPYNVLHFGFYAAIARTARPLLAPAIGGAAIGPLCGALTGTIVAALTQPMDLLNTRRQVGTAGNERSRGVLPSLLAIAQREGPSALFRGWRPRCAQYTASGAVFFGVWSAVLERWPSSST